MIDSATSGSEAPNLKKLRSGRPRRWDARVTPEMVVAMLHQEAAEPQWLTYLVVLENGQTISKTVRKAEAIAQIEASPAVGFVGAVRVENAIRFFSRQLKASKAAQIILDGAIADLQRRAEESLQQELNRRKSGGPN